MKTQEFLDAIARALSRDPGTVVLDDTPETIEEWDSIGHLSIIATVDSELGIAVDSEELLGFTCIRELVELLKARGALED